MMRNITILLAIGLLLTAPAASQAADYFVQSSEKTAGPPVTVVTGDRLRLAAKGDASYECTIYGPADASTVRFTSVSDAIDSAVSYKNCGLISPGVNASGNVFERSRTRVCFSVASPGGTYSLGLSVDTASESARFHCRETTLYGGYNTNVADFNFLELTNTSDGDLTVTVTAKTSEGATVFADRLFTIPAGRRTDINIHEATGAAVYGPLIIKHNGPFGALRGDLSEYEITSTSPFNSTKTAVTPCLTRE